MYTKYSEEEKQAARNANLLDYLQRRGYAVVKHGANEHMVKEHDSIKISNNLWCRFSRQNIDSNGEVSFEGGNTLDFAMKIEGLTFPEAMQSIMGQMSYGLSQYQYNYEQKKEEKAVQLPDQNADSRHVFAYLCKTRCIDEEIVRSLIKDKMLYESKDHHNCVFVTRDEEGVARYAFIRGTHSEKKFVKESGGSSKSYGILMKGSSDTVYVFEAVIDAMSHATLSKRDGSDWKKDYRLSLGGVSPLALNRLLAKNDQIKKIVICTDNDEAGHEAALNMKRLYEGKGYEVHREAPYDKDFNEDLQQLSLHSKSMARAI